MVVVYGVQWFGSEKRNRGLSIGVRFSFQGLWVLLDRRLVHCLSGFGTLMEGRTTQRITAMDWAAVATSADYTLA